MPAKMETGLAVVHLFCRPSDRLRHDAVSEAVERATESGCQVVTAAILGHKADLVVMALAPDLAPLRALQSSLRRAGLDVVDSYVSITEVSEYAAGLPEHMLRARLHPELPPEGLDTFCFYPMSKKRDAHANWYATPFESRDAMMREHGKSGRAFAGRIVQLITASTGLDDHEWGVTLFATTPEVVKDVVYTLRFDEGSALYGDFGRFYVGYVSPIADLLG